MTIRRELFETLHKGNLATSRWFIPEPHGITASMINDAGKFWSNLITCRHELALPGGTFVVVRAYVHHLEYLHGKAEHHLNAFTEAFDEAIAVWLPTSPLESAKLFRELMNERHLNALSAS